MIITRYCKVFYYTRSMQNYSQRNNRLHNNKYIIPQKNKYIKPLKQFPFGNANTGLKGPPTLLPNESEGREVDHILYMITLGSCLPASRPITDMDRIADLAYTVYIPRVVCSEQGEPRKFIQVTGARIGAPPSPIPHYSPWPPVMPTNGGGQRPSWCPQCR